MPTLCHDQSEYPVEIGDVVEFKAVVIGRFDKTSTVEGEVTKIKPRSQKVTVKYEDTTHIIRSSGLYKTVRQDFDVTDITFVHREY